jgi:SAM-dependent methyltransferase
LLRRTHFMGPERSGDVTYSADQFAALFAVEDRHFWFQARNRCIAAALRSLPNFDAISRVLEVGCGTGVVLAELQRLFPTGQITGLDLFEEGLSFARRRFQGTLVQGDVFTHTFDEQFDVVGAFDVIEHLDDDQAILSRFWQQIRPGGYVLLTVPAHQGLWSYFDEVAHHRRRYDVKGLTQKLTAAGFADIYVTPFMAALLPIMWLKRRLIGDGISGVSRADSKRRQGAVESDLHVGSVPNLLLSRLISRRVRVPFGTSLLALAKRPQARTSRA